jgi:hypothetical protein
VLVGVALVLQLGTLGDEAFAAFLAAAAENVATGLGGHAGTETELVLAGAFGRLEGAFAHGWILGREKGLVAFRLRRGGRILARARPVSIHQCGKIGFFLIRRRRAVRRENVGPVVFCWSVSAEL